MSYPGEGVEGMYRNDITQVAAYLDHKHQDHYMIFNLSERNYNFELFHGRVIDYGWPDHHGPPLQVLIDVVSNIDRWVRSDPKNVAIVHCLAGRGRTGTAICAYLCFAGYFASMAKALQYYANVRSNKGKGVTQPSQLRYCKYVDLILSKNLVPKPKSVSITRITITPIPTMTTQLGIRPILNIYRYAPGVQELVWTSMKDTSEATFYGPKDGEISFDISDMPPIAGDVMIKMSHVTSWMWVGSKTEIIMRLILNTSFLAEGTNVLTLTKRDLDIAHKDPRFQANTQLFLYSTSVPNCPPLPKTSWDPEKFDIWAETARQHRSKLVAADLHNSLPLSPASSSSSESSSSAPENDYQLKENPSTITFNPFVPPVASSTPPVSDATKLFPPHRRHSITSPAPISSPSPAQAFLEASERESHRSSSIDASSSSIPPISQPPSAATSSPENNQPAEGATFEEASIKPDDDRADVGEQNVSPAAAIEEEALVQSMNDCTIDQEESGHFDESKADDTPTEQQISDSNGDDVDQAITL